MRIRTIKPGFWKSYPIAGLPDDTTRLMFIGLWNYCDDEGRGYDDSRLIKAELFPLDDSKTTRKIDKVMTALASAGRIVRYEAAGRRVFQVLNWSEHQRVEKPQGSTIPPLLLPDDSGSPPRKLPDRSRLDRKGVGKESSSSTVSDASRAGEPVDDDDLMEIQQETLDRLVRRHLGDRMRAEVVAKLGPVSDVAAWSAADRRNTLGRHGDRLKALTAGTATEMAELLEPAPRCTTVVPPPFARPSEPPELPDPEVGKAKLDEVRAVLRPAHR